MTARVLYSIEGSTHKDGVTFVQAGMRFRVIDEHRHYHVSVWCQANGWHHVVNVPGSDADDPVEAARIAQSILA